MANLDFLSIPMGRYIKNHLDFARDLKNPPLVFGVNYFLKDKEGNYLTGMQDKRVWLKWMELRFHHDVEAIKTPIGYLPKYEDLRKLFKELFNQDYPEKNYLSHFKIRIPENLAKIERVLEIYRTNVPDAPNVLFELLEQQKKRLKKTRAKYGDYVIPTLFYEE